MWPFNLQRVAIESPMSCQCVAIESQMSCQCVAIQSPKRCQCVAIESQNSCQCDAVESPMNYQYSIQFNSLFQTHLRSITHNYVSHHNRTMQHQHINDRLCGLISVHVAAENRQVILLPPFESLDSFWITRSQRSRRRRDKGLYPGHNCGHNNSLFQFALIEDFHQTSDPQIA